MANLIGHAVDHQLREGKVSAIELFEILSDYVNRTDFKKRYGPDNESYDGYTEYGRGQDIAALWRLVLKVPEYISDILIKNLPPGAGLSSGIPEDVLSGMSDGQLTTLFNREDIDLKDLRKKIFFEAGENRDEVKDAAMLYNFDLDYAEFTAILDSPKNVADKIIDDLPWARNLSLWLYVAIHDVVSERDVGRFRDAEFAPKSFNRRLEELKGWQRGKQLRELNLYRLAREAVSWKRGEKGSPLSEELEFLSKAVVEGDTWGTFIAFSNIQKENSPDSQKLNKYLSRIGDTGEDDESGQVDDGDEDERTDLLDRIEKLTEAVSSLTEQAEDKQIELTDILRELSKDVARLQTQLWDEHLAKLFSTTTRKADEIKKPPDETKKQLEDGLDELTTDVTGLRATQDRQTLLLYVAIGLLVWLLIKLW